MPIRVRCVWVSNWTTTRTPVQRSHRLMLQSRTVRDGYGLRPIGYRGGGAHGDTFQLGRMSSAATACVTNVDIGYSLLRLRSNTGSMSIGART